MGTQLAEPKICGIYMIINSITGDRYIGQSIDIVRRYKEHLRINTHGTPDFHKDIERFGKKNFIPIILEECDRSLLNEKEEYYIRFFEPEYNKSLGQGQKGIKIADSTKKLLSEKARERWNNLSGNEKNNAIQRMCDNHKVGYKLTNETKEKIRQKKLGTKASNEARKKMSESQKLRRKLHGAINHRTCPIICMNDGRHFGSIKEAGAFYGIYSANISAVLSGKQKKTHDLCFIYDRKE